MRMATAKCLTVALMLAAGMITAPLPGETLPRTEAYRLQTTGNVQLSLPASGHSFGIIFRDAGGRWQPVDMDVSDGRLQIRIEANRIKNGRTMLVLEVPDHVNLNDQEPPQVLRFKVDGEDYGPQRSVALGGVEAAPRHIAIEVADKANWLRASTLRVIINGRPYRLRDRGIEFERMGPKHGIIRVAVTDLLEGMRSDNTVTVTIDDYGLTEEPLYCSLSFRHTPPYRMDDGTLLSVDTVTSASGWQEWWVVVNGEKMDTSSGSTAGKTWLSEASSQPHWIRMEFVEPRQVSGVRLWWAHYECYRTSTAYEVQTWDGNTWITQVKVSDQGERQCSEHTFEPVTTTAVRVWQPPLSGHPGRADHMWVSEFEVF